MSIQTIISKGGEKFFQTWNPLRNKMKFQESVSTKSEGNESQYIFTFELPGVTEDQIDVSYENGILSVRVKKQA